MAYTTIDDPSAYFQTALYTGNLVNGHSITNDGNSDLQPDLTWIKTRSSSTYNHVWVDSSRGNNLVINSNLSNAEADIGVSVVTPSTDGFSLADWSHVNYTGVTYAAWQWKANGGTTSSNTDGTLTSTVQANTDAGFSIVTFTGNGSNDATIGHGLGVTPAMIITKNRADTVSWRVWHKDLTSTYMLFINSNNAETSPTAQGNGYIKTVGSSTYSVYQGLTDTNGVNGSGDAMVSYCFAEKQGYSKFGKYTGNGNANGPFVYTGFKPAWIMIKCSSSSTDGNWWIIDNKRDTYNVTRKTLEANTINAEATPYDRLDFLSNGFKNRVPGSNGWNVSGETYIYMAFAENPFVTSTGIPTTAR